MTRRFTQLAGIAATATYLLIVLGAIVRITGSGMGCGEHWPLCRGQLLPPLDLPTLIEYAHRLAAAAVSVLVVALAVYGWRLTRQADVPGSDRADGRVATPTERQGLGPSAVSAVALGLLALQVALGAVTVRLRLPAWTVILHLGTAMLLLATLLVAARGSAAAVPPPTGFGALALGFGTVLFGALTANTGAASACLGFPLCNGQVLPGGTALQYLHGIHRLLAFTLFGYVLWWATRARERAVWSLLGLVTLQVSVGAALVLLALPQALQIAHVAAGTAVWAGIVLVAFRAPILQDVRC
jgi:heme A synthase